MVLPQKKILLCLNPGSQEDAGIYIFFNLVILKDEQHKTLCILTASCWSWTRAFMHPRHECLLLPTVDDLVGSHKWLLENLLYWASECLLSVMGLHFPDLENSGSDLISMGGSPLEVNWQVDAPTHSFGGPHPSRFLAHWGTASLRFASMRLRMKYVSLFH